jgi:hypothetical protein
LSRFSDSLEKKKDFSDSCVSVFSIRGLLIPTIWGLGLGFYIPSRKGVLALPRGDASCCLIAAALRFGRVWQLSRSANELRLQNFLITSVKELWRQGLQRPWKFCAQTKTKIVTGWPSNVWVVGKLEDMWCMNEMCQVTWRESGVLIHGSEATSYCLRWN